MKNSEVRPELREWFKRNVDMGAKLDVNDGTIGDIESKRLWEELNHIISCVTQPSQPLTQHFQEDSKEVSSTSGESQEAMNASEKDKYQRHIDQVADLLRDMVQQNQPYINIAMAIEEYYTDEQRAEGKQVITGRARRFGLTTKMVAEWNKAGAKGKRVRYEARDWLAMDRATYNDIIQQAEQSAYKRGFQEAEALYRQQAARKGDE